VIVDEVDRQDDHHEEKDDSHDEDMVLLLDQERWKCNSNIEGTSSIRITIFQTFLLSLFISKTFICLRDHDELGTGFGVILVPIRMIQKGKFPIGFLNLFDGGVILHLQDLIGIEALHILLGADDDARTLEDSVCDACQQQDLDNTTLTLSTNLKVI
jgi:hypothetical protein